MQNHKISLVVAQIINTDRAMKCLWGVSLLECLLDSLGVSAVWITLLIIACSSPLCKSFVAGNTDILFSELNLMSVYQVNWLNPESYSGARNFKLYLSMLMSKMELSLQIHTVQSNCHVSAQLKVLFPLFLSWDTYKVIAEKVNVVLINFVHCFPSLTQATLFLDGVIF